MRSLLLSIVQNSTFSCRHRTVPGRLTNCTALIQSDASRAVKCRTKGFIYATDWGSKGGLKLTPFQVMGANHYKSKDTRAVSQDIEINVGSVFSSWNPASHSDYWTDDDLTIPIAQFLSRLLLQ